MRIKHIFTAFCILILGGSSFILNAQITGTEANPYILAPSATTVAWGYYWSEAPAVLRIQ